MTDNTDKLMADALVECGYADDINEDHTAHAHQCGHHGDDIDWEFRKIEPFADTLEGRRQADALIDWLRGKNLIMEHLLECNDSCNELNEFDNRCATIKWCFKKLGEQS